MIRSILIGMALGMLMTNAEAGALKVFNVSAPEINCVFNTTCKLIVGDTIADLTSTPLGRGAFVQSRTFQGQPNTPAAGATAYEYRIDLRNAAKTDCIVGIVINFGPALQLPVGPDNAKGEVFVTTKGGIGDVGIKSAEQNGDLVAFTFDKHLCPGETSYFFGLASLKPPVKSSATLFAFAEAPFIPTEVRVPQH